MFAAWCRLLVDNKMLMAGRRLYAALEGRLGIGRLRIALMYSEWDSTLSDEQRALQGAALLPE